MLKTRWARQFDWIALVLMFAIVAIGLLVLAHSTALPYAEESGVAGIIERLRLATVSRQLLWFGTGLVLMAAVIAVDYETIGRFTPYLYWLCISLLVAVLIIGTATHGTKAWFEFGSQKMQPSEFAKIAMIVALAKMLSQHEGSIHRFSDLLPTLFYFAVPFALVLLQGDLGTALVFLAILLGQLFLGEVSGKLMLVIIGTMAAAAPPIYSFLLKDYQRQRLTSFITPIENDTTDATYNIGQSRMAVGSGQMNGKGLFSEANMSQLDSIPVKTSDFAFAAAAEAVGFLGCLGIVALYGAFLFRCLYMAMQAKDRFGRLIIVGFVCMILFHVLENIGMCIGIMPITGIPLPFFSYGGSNMWANMIGMGLVLNVSMRRNKTLFRGGGFDRD